MHPTEDLLHLGVVHVAVDLRRADHRAQHQPLRIRTGERPNLLLRRLGIRRRGSPLLLRLVVASSLERKRAEHSHGAPLGGASEAAAKHRAGCSSEAADLGTAHAARLLLAKEVTRYLGEIAAPASARSPKPPRSEPSICSIPPPLSAFCTPIRMLSWDWLDMPLFSMFPMMLPKLMVVSLFPERGSRGWRG
jgi:hypothetical protein